MKPISSLVVVVAVGSFAACVPPQYLQPSAGVLATNAQSAESAQPQTESSEAQGAIAEPQPDERTPAQVVVDILGASGYACVINNNQYECYGAQDTWPFVVSYEPQADGSTQVLFESFLGRAFAQPCRTFRAAVRDLRDDSAGFSATCEDATQTFRLRQRLVYDGSLDVATWAADHLNRRAFAGKQLRGIHALSKDSARLVARR